MGAHKHYKEWIPAGSKEIIGNLPVSATSYIATKMPYNGRLHFFGEKFLPWPALRECVTVALIWVRQRAPCTAQRTTDYCFIDLNPCFPSYIHSRIVSFICTFLLYLCETLSMQCKCYHNYKNRRRTVIALKQLEPHGSGTSQLWIKMSTMCKKKKSWRRPGRGKRRTVKRRTEWCL